MGMDSPEDRGGDSRWLCMCVCVCVDVCVCVCVHNWPYPSTRVAVGLHPMMLLRTCVLALYKNSATPSARGTIWGP